jgi:hypothetical protein
MLPHERPDDKLMEDDNALDTWWTQYVAEKTREAAKVFGKQMRQSGASQANIPTFAMPS